MPYTAHTFSKHGIQFKIKFKLQLNYQQLQESAEINTNVVAFLFP